jgi:hypothetical protein
VKIIKTPGYVGSASQFRVGPKMGGELVRKAQEYLSTGNGSKLIGPNMEAIVSDIQSNGFFFAVPMQGIDAAVQDQSSGGAGYYKYYASSGNGVHVSLNVTNNTWHQIQSGANPPPNTVEYVMDTNTSGGLTEIELWNTHKGMWLWPGVAYKFTLDPESGRFIPIDLPMQPVITAKIYSQDIAFGSSGTAQVYFNGVPFGINGDLKFITVHHDWVKFGEELQDGADVFVQWFPERGASTTGQWVVVGGPQTTTSDIAVVEIVESPGIADCALVNRSQQCVYQGKIAGNNPAAANQCGDTPWSLTDDCLIVDITGCQPATQLKKGDRYLGKRIGIIAMGEEEMPLYAIRGDKSTTSVAVIEIATESQGFDDCQTVQTNDGCVYDAILSSNNLGNQCETPWVDGTPVWAINVAACNQPANVKKADRFVAVSMGDLTIGEVTKPLYAFRHVDGGDQTKIVTVLPYASQPLACQTIDPAAPDCILNGRISSALAFGDPDEFGNECNVQNWTNEDEIWIVNLATCGDKVQIPFGERFIGQYIMDYEHQEATKPLYAIYYRPSSAGSSAIVAVNVIGPESCHPITPNNSCVYPGSLIFNGDDEPDVCQTDNFVEGADIWIVDVASCNDPGSIPNGERFVGHRLGYHTHAGETLPLYGIKHVPANIGVANAYFESETMISSTIDTQDFFFSGSGTGVSPRSGLSIVGGALFNSSGVQLRYQVHAQFVIFPLSECETAGGAIGLGGLPGGAYISTTYQHAGWPLDADQHCVDSQWPITAPNFVGCISGVITVPANAVVSGWHFRANGDAIMTYYMRGTLTRLE